MWWMMGRGAGVRLSSPAEELLKGSLGAAARQVRDSVRIRHCWRNVENIMVQNGKRASDMLQGPVLMRAHIEAYDSYRVIVLSTRV
jgi:hypothetical protein